MADGKRPARRIEEDEVQGEAHAEGVNARAAWNQQAGPGLVAIKERQAEQAGSAVVRNRNPFTEDGDSREPPKPWGKAPVHVCASVTGRRVSPRRPATL